MLASLFQLLFINRRGTYIEQSMLSLTVEMKVSTCHVRFFCQLLGSLTDNQMGN